MQFSYKSLNIYIHHVAALQNQDLKKKRFQVQILCYKLKDTSSSSTTRKVIFRFEGANPSRKAMFQVDLTGSFHLAQTVHMDVTILLAQRCQTGLWFAFCLLSQAEKSKCEEKEEGKNCIFFPGKINECRGNISISYRVWITFLDEQGYHLTLTVYFREPVKFRKEKTASTLQRKLLGYPMVVSFTYPYNPSLSDLEAS